MGTWEPHVPWDGGSSVGSEAPGSHSGSQDFCSWLQAGDPGLELSANSTPVFAVGTLGILSPTMSLLFSDQLGRFFFP